MRFHVARKVALLVLGSLSCTSAPAPVAPSDVLDAGDDMSAMQEDAVTDTSNPRDTDMMRVDVSLDARDASEDGGDASMDRVEGDMRDAGDAGRVDGSADAPVDRLPRLDPIYAPGPVPVARIMGGGKLFLATARDGTLWGWGDNWGGLMQPATEWPEGDDYRSRPQRIDGVTNVRELLSTGGAGLCVLAGIPPEGALYCWGRAAYDMYGNASRDPPNPFDAWEDWQYPQRMNPMVSDIVSLAQFNNVLRSDRAVWEFNGYRGYHWERYPEYAGRVVDYEYGIFLFADGVLAGYESHPDTQPARYRYAPGLQRIAGIVELTARNEHACMRINDGRVLCWGRNEWGAAGNFDLGGQCGTDGARWGHCVQTPTEIPGIRDAVKVVTGDYWTCAIRRDGALWCWGGNVPIADGRGSIGDGRPVDETCGDEIFGPIRCRRRPAQVVGLSNVVDVAIALDSTCALVASGQVYCWGYNTGGRLAVGTTTHEPLPRLVRW